MFRKISVFLSENFQFLVVNFVDILCSSTCTTVAIDSLRGQRKPNEVSRMRSGSGSALSANCIRAFFLRCELFNNALMDGHMLKAKKINIYDTKFFKLQ